MYARIHIYVYTYTLLRHPPGRQRKSHAGKYTGALSLGRVVLTHSMRCNSLPSRRTRQKEAIPLHSRHILISREDGRSQPATTLVGSSATADRNKPKEVVVCGKRPCLSVRRPSHRRGNCITGQQLQYAASFQLKWLLPMLGMFLSSFARLSQPWWQMR